MRELVRTLLRSRRVRITLVLLVICLAAGLAWLSRARPLTREACAEKAQSLVLSCGMECTAARARAPVPDSPETQKVYLDCTDLCSHRLVDLVKSCGR